MTIAATFVDTLKISLSEAGGNVIIPKPLEYNAKALAMDIDVQSFIDKTTVKVKTLIADGLFNPLIATPLELRLWEKIKRKEQMEEKAKGASNSLNERNNLEVSRRNAGEQKTSTKANFLQRRVPFFFATEVYEQNDITGFENITATKGRYSLHYKGGEQAEALKRKNALPLEGFVGNKGDKGKKFVIRNIRVGETPDQIIVDVDLIENPIPLIILGVAVAGSALGVGGWFLTKAQKILSSPILYLVVIGLFVLLFTGKLGGK